MVPISVKHLRLSTEKESMPPNTNGSRPAVVMALPFTASAHEHVENAQTVTVVQTAAVQNLNPIDVPAYGYLRHLVIEVVGAGGTGGTMSADGPWNIIQSVSLQDVNGANIVGPLDGYALYLANIVGGYVFNNNPSNIPSFAGSAPNPVFQIRVPVEISARDGFGALANQNTAANFKLSLSINSTAVVYSSAPSVLPTYTIRVWLEAWTVPAPANNRGDTQAQVPPLLGTGQFWSQMTRTTLSGNNTVLLTRTGNLIRNLVLVGRDVSGVRSDAVLMDPLQFNWDGNQIHNASLRYFKNYLFERMSGAFTYPGVWVTNHLICGYLAHSHHDLSLWVTLPLLAQFRLSRMTLRRLNLIRRNAIRFPMIRVG
jgi:hypothetical protein